MAKMSYSVCKIPLLCALYLTKKKMVRQLLLFRLVNRVIIPCWGVVLCFMSSIQGWLDRDEVWINRWIGVN